MTELDSGGQDTVTTSRSDQMLVVSVVDSVIYCQLMTLGMLPEVNIADFRNAACVNCQLL